MNDVYVHTLKYHYYGFLGKRRSRTMFPVSYGPFDDEDAAWEWIRQRGFVRSTKLMRGPAKENIKVSDGQPIQERYSRLPGFVRSRLRRDSVP